MAFRKRNVGLVARDKHLAAESNGREPHTDSGKPESAGPSGIRPSPVDGRPVTSTGIPSLDGLLAGHSGLPLGYSILIEESAPTDYAGSLLRYFAAEGVVQQHHVHVVGMGQNWGKELPGLVGTASDPEAEKAFTPKDQERMKIAWRYQKLGEFGAESSRVPNRREGVAGGTSNVDLSVKAFCHAFDLTKRLVLPSPAAINFLPIKHTGDSASPFASVVASLEKLIATAPSSVHRVIVPSLLSPALYAPEACRPENVLRFFQSLQALLRQNSGRTCVMVSLPTALYPRTTGLTRWMELLSDGVLELIPFPHKVDFGQFGQGGATKQEEDPQGLLKVHRLPIINERGGSASNAGIGADLAFTMTRKRFQIKPFSLPPVGGEEEPQRGAEPSKAELEF